MNSGQQDHEGHTASCKISEWITYTIGNILCLFALSALFTLLNRLDKLRN